MNTAEQKAQQEYPNEYRLNRSSERVAYIKGYAAGQEALPLAMSEEEIEREADKWCGSEEYNRCESTTEALKVFAMRVLARSKSLTVEKGRTFTEGEVRVILRDLLAAAEDGPYMPNYDRMDEMVRLHGLSFDPA